MSDNTIKAPWTAAQVLALNRWQHAPFAHMRDHLSALAFCEETNRRLGEIARGGV